MRKLSYTNGASNIPPLGETIDENPRRTVTKLPSNDALILMHRHYRATYTEFYEQVIAVAKGLIALGVRSGDRVGIWSPNCYEWTLLQYATAKIGAIMVNINLTYRTSELIYVINQSGLSYIFSAIQSRTSHCKKMIGDACEFTNTLRREVHWGESWEYFLAQGKKVSDQKLQSYKARVQLGDPVNTQYASGTMGNPRGVTPTHHNTLSNAYFMGVRMNYTDKDRVCIPVPFYHCFGMVIGDLCCMTHGATMVIPNGSFDATKTLEAVEREHCTPLYEVSTMFTSELYTLDRHPYDLSSLRTGVMVGALCPPETMKRVKEQMNMHEITTCYGMTGTSPVSI